MSQPPYQPMPPQGPPPPAVKPWHKRWWVWALAAVAFITFVGIMAQLQPDRQPASPPTQPSTQATKASTKAEPKPSSEKPSRCVKVKPEFAAAILDGAPKGVTLTQVGDAYAVESTENPGNWFVAIRFKHPAGEDTGVWQSLNLEGGPFRSVDGFSKNFTQWPDSGNAGAPIVDEAKSCLK